MEESVTIDRAVELLNQCFEADPNAMHNLVETRVDCSESLAAHPTVQVCGKETPQVGLLGILNGLFGVDERGFGPITAMYDLETDRLVGFAKTQQPNRRKQEGTMLLFPEE